MNIIISGASGFIGLALVPHLAAAGHQVFRLVRHTPASERDIRWQPGEALDPSTLPAGLDAVINLSGSSIAVPFTKKNKLEIINSRTASTRTLVQAVLQLEAPPRVFLNASGFGYYDGTSFEEQDEMSPPGNDFVAEVCQVWERELDDLHSSPIRAHAMRTGIVLSPDGGALAQMLPAFRSGFGAILGDGRQWMSWISLRDYLRAVDFLLVSASLNGAVNLVSPLPVSNALFSKALAKALGRPLLFKAPAFMLKAAMGEMAELMLLSSLRVIPRKLQDSGFDWIDTDLERTFEDFFRRRKG